VAADQKERGSRRRSLRTLSAVGLGVVVLVVAAGCVDPLAWDPLSRPAPTVSCTSVGALSQPPTLPVGLVPGLRVQTRTNETSLVHAAVPVFPQLPELNNRLSEVLRGTVASFTAQRVAGPGSELNVSWSLIGVSDQTLGVMLTERRALAGASEDQQLVFWFDRLTRQILKPRDLFTPQGWRALRSAVISDLCSPLEAQSPQLLRAFESDPSGQLMTVSFAADGGALLTLKPDRGTGQSGRPLVQVRSATTITRWLSPSGLAAQQAAVHPVAFASVATGGWSEAPRAPQASSPSTPRAAPSAEPTPTPRPAVTQLATTPRPAASSSQTPAGHPVAPQNPSRPTARNRPPAPSCAVLRCVALTFDDGPGEYTTQLVRTLTKARIPATFFMMGSQVDAYPDVARQVQRAGFQIGNHSYSHPDLSRLEPTEIDEQLLRTTAAIRRATGVTPRVMRPPYGARNAYVDRAATAAGMAEVLWDVDPLDWKYRDSAIVTEHVMSGVRRGSIILLHDIHPTTVAAVPALVAELRSRGYTLVTLTRLVGPPKPGARYFRAE
jgi:peptidoglycan/xylan/chitin deacetylase (PgdA/CDA1 family)